MERHLLVRSIAIATTAAALAAPAAASAGAVGGGPTVLGNGATKIGTTFNFFGQTVGGVTFGTASFVNPKLPDRSGPIVCLKVKADATGPRALFGVQIGPASYSTFVIQDRGFGNDRVRGVALTSTPPTCTGTVPSVAARYTIVSGDIAVMGV